MPKKPSDGVNLRIRTALDPFLEYRDDWIFHYPIYLNTFCMTYDLAALLAGATTSPPRKDALGGNFRRHDWWQGLPHFTYTRDIEIFVGLDSMIEQAKTEGHDIEKSKHAIRFTRYNVRRVFVRKDKKRQSTGNKWLLVTDVPPTARELIRAWEDNPPAWLQDVGNPQFTEGDIRPSWTRELHDFFETARKLYLFSAPMAHVLRRQPGKYTEFCAAMDPIDTYFVFRTNSDVDSVKIEKLGAAVQQYYQLIFEPDQAEELLHPLAAERYARIASTVGQPQPFPEVHLRKGSMQSGTLNHRYAQILRDHHQ